MEKLGLNEIREKYLRFFENKGHKRLKSFPLLPQGDSSLLLVNSGMAPLKPYFSGEVAPPANRVTTCQKCIRTPDIERVGRTSRHGTFFEMLGNFSFGDYFKREATAWAWEFVTEVLEIPVENIHISVYLDDDEAYDIWTKEVGVDPSHVVRLGKADNFWEIGAGPCGPCSEIYYDRGEKYGCGSPNCGVGCDCDRYVEFWNLVFTQFNNDGAGNYTPLTQKNIDTGMGLERLACIMQEVPSLFDVDTVMNITKHVSDITAATYGIDEKTDVSLRVITDHIRSTTMLVCDGILPSNEGRGYVLRRLLRRAARHGKLLGVSHPFLYEVAETVIKESALAYPELAQKRDYIIRIIKAEEERFNQTIDAGLKILLEMVDGLKKRSEKLLSGDLGFRWYDTYRFPVDLTMEILAENGFSVDRDGFDKLMNEQRERARAATAALGDHGWEGVDLGLSKDVVTEFTGYSEFESEARILAIIVDEENRASAYAGERAVVVLDRTPFYAERGGQVADTGVITAGDGSSLSVLDVRATKDGKYMHLGTVSSGEIKADSAVKASIDAERRRAVMRAHSAAHLLQRALKNTIGEHVEQAGSFVSPDHVRFDFTHFSQLTPDELSIIENEINEKILADLPILTSEKALEEAKAMGATALFGEKYGDIVRVVQMGDYSLELCGGTHLQNTAKIGSFAIVGEFSIASGVRRIEAVTGKKMLEMMNDRVRLTRGIAEMLKTSPGELMERVHQQLDELKVIKRELERYRSMQISGSANEFLKDAEDIGGLKVVATAIEDMGADDLKKIGDAIKSGHDDIVAVIASVSEGRLTFLAVCGKDAVARGISAGELIREVTKIAGGSGGGKPEMAMGGGRDPEKIEEALSFVSSMVRKKLG